MKSGRGLYKLDSAINFKFIGEALPPREKSPRLVNNHQETDDSLEKRIAHTHDLKVAIRNWIDHFPQPTYKYSLDQDMDVSSEISVCNGHPFFSDLSNHFSPLGINVLVDWDDYKKELLAINELKAKVFDNSKHTVLACF